MERTETSPGFGLSARLPSFPVAFVEPIYCSPLQWRGRTGFTPVSVFAVRRFPITVTSLALGIASRKRVGQFRLEEVAFLLVQHPLYI